MAYQRIESAKALTLYLQVTDVSGSLIVPEDVTYVKYSITERGGAVVGSHSYIDLFMADTIKAATAWDVDDVGYNVAVACDATFFPNLSTHYFVKIAFGMAEGEFVFTVEVETYGTSYNASDYCERSDIEDVFGPHNVAKWSDIENQSDPAFIAYRIAWAIQMATNEIDDRLRGGAYDLPFAPIPETIRTVAATLAGVMLYESRGIEDIEESTGKPLHKLHWHRNRVEKTLTEIRSGIRKLGGGLSNNRKNTNVPFSF